MLMQVDLPHNYPSEQPPALHLTAPWLTHQQLQQLQQHLLGMWNDSPGLPICYTWVDWLQQDSLKHLGLSDAIDLSVFVPRSPSEESRPASSTQSCNSCPDKDSAVVNHHVHPTRDQSQTPEDVLVTLLQFDVAEKQRAFRNGTWDCGICFEQTPGRQCVQASLQCQHVYCQDCMRQHCALHVKEGSLEFLRCPVPDCKEPLDRQVSLCATRHARRRTTRHHVIHTTPCLSHVYTLQVVEQRVASPSIRVVRACVTANCQLVS